MNGMNLAAISHHPLPASPIKGEVQGWWETQNLAPNAMRHLPLDGGGWEGVTAPTNPSISTLAPGAAA